ncbi:MAG: hypothetical protein FWD92_06305 [Methanomassiliicoccaceae archaeon]|nr:hypothetical protein [Methanomassiliicoccaceae archaeon]
MGGERTRFLEGAFIAPILITLYEHGDEVMKAFLIAIVEGGRNTSARRYKELEELGLISIRKNRIKSSGHWISLTDKGKRIAKYLIEIDKILLEP